MQLIYITLFRFNRNYAINQGHKKMHKKLLNAEY